MDRRTYLLDVSAIPANALYQAINAVMTPKIPPALLMLAFKPPTSVCWNRAIARSRNVMSKKKNSEKNATVDFSVHRRRMVVKIHHPIR